MTQDLLRIKRPSLPARWSKEQMEAGAVRIHQRFQGLLTSVIESADWANYRMVKDPLEVGRPSWPDPGKYCDLILQRRSGHVEAALEIKTRHVGPLTNPTDAMHKVLDDMGTMLFDLQRAAHEADAVWIVAVGLYRVNFQAMALSHDTEWSDVVLVWGRDIGRDSPMASMRWPSIASLDHGMCNHKELSSFFECFSYPRKSAPPPPAPAPPAPAAPTSTDRGALSDLIELSAWLGLKASMRLALLMVSEWPETPLPLRTRAREYQTIDVSEYAIQHQVFSLVEAGVVKGYRKGKRSHQLTLDVPALRAYVGGDDE